MYSSMLSYKVSQNYGRGWSVTEFKKLRRPLYVLKRGSKMLLPVCTSVLFALKFNFLKNLVEDMSRFWVFLLWMCCHTNRSTQLSKLRTVTNLNDGQHIWMRWWSVRSNANQCTQRDFVWKKMFFYDRLSKTVLLMERGGSFIVRSSFSVSLGDARSEFSLGNNPNL